MNCLFVNHLQATRSDDRSKCGGQMAWIQMTQNANRIQKFGPYIMLKFCAISQRLSFNYTKQTKKFYDEIKKMLIDS